VVTPSRYFGGGEPPPARPRHPKDDLDGLPEWLFYGFDADELQALAAGAQLLAGKHEGTTNPWERLHEHLEEALTAARTPLPEPTQLPAGPPVNQVRVVYFDAPKGGNQLEPGPDGTVTSPTGQAYASVVPTSPAVAPTSPAPDEDGLLRGPSGIVLGHDERRYQPPAGAVLLAFPTPDRQPRQASNSLVLSSTPVQVTVDGDTYLVPGDWQDSTTWPWALEEWAVDWYTAGLSTPVRSVELVHSRAEAYRLARMGMGKPGVVRHQVRKRVCRGFANRPLGQGPWQDDEHPPPRSPLAGEPS
jgi:hypothetical protein